MNNHNNYNQNNEMQMQEGSRDWEDFTNGIIK